MKRYRLKILLLLLLFAAGLWAQTDLYNHPELDWYTLTTEHFEVHFHNGAERSARTVAKIAEEIYGPITRLYRWQPNGKIHFIIKDYEDNSNGAAFYYDNKVEIWAPQMTFILRGTHNWLRNVVTHEFAHMVSLGASRKISRRIPSLFLQYFSYEREKRPDVLYGYPNAIASYPLPMTVIPMWLAEGMAQYQVQGFDYDRWDSHRDMLIRTAIEANEALSFDEMGVFGKNSLGNERTYNSGYAFVRYIAENWGQETLYQMADKSSHLLTVSINKTLKEITGKPAKKLYNSWTDRLETYYETRLQQIKQHRLEGKILTPRGVGNVYPVWSPDGSKIVYCGGSSNDYLGMTSLWLYDLKTDQKRRLKSGINSRVDWSNDGNWLLYAEKKRGSHGSQYFDLFSFSLKDKKEKRLTRELRAVDPAWAPDDSMIVCVIQKDGTDNLLLTDREGKTERYLTKFNNGEGVYAPVWMPDGKRIVFSQARRHGRDLKMLDIETCTITGIITGEGDARDPAVSPDSEALYFAWDKTGIFNIYRYTFADSSVSAVTNVVGGAFMPSVSARQELAFSNFKYDGYKIALLHKITPLSEKKVNYQKAAEFSDLALEPFEFSNSDSILVAARNYDDTKLPQMDAEPYHMTYGQLTLLPRIAIDSNRVKLGTYFYAGDVLNRYSVLGGAAMDVRTDLDAFAIFEYRGMAPTLFLELYAYTRHMTTSIEVIPDYPKKIPVDLSFQLLEADIGAGYRLGDSHLFRTAFVHSRYTSKIKDFFFQGITWQSPRNTYFVGNQFQVNWMLNGIVPGIDSNINPSRGLRIDLNYSYELNKFFEDFSVDNDYGTVQEVYTDYNYHRIDLNLYHYMPNPFFKRHALGLNLHAGWIDRSVDGFFNFYAGGLPGLRGYPFYSIGGRKLAVARLSYRFPFLFNWQKRFFNLTTNHIYAGAFFDYGHAFNEDKIDFSAFKKSVGMSLRFEGFSFYGYPTALSLDAAYGLDEVTYFDDEVKASYIYGKEWRFYVTLLFDFLD
ncbi:hypothetical protein GF407_15315 [candidate division KSB1 bacterium]|nr:hypothetical protein [candidate division KSB1 bacterium]